MNLEEQNFAEFLRTGKLGLLNIGMTPLEVVNLLGEPDHKKSAKPFLESVPSEKIRRAYHGTFGADYGILQLIFSSETETLDCFSITLHEARPRKLPKRLKVNWLKLIEGMTRKTFKAFVDQHQIECLRQRWSPDMDAETAASLDSQALFLRIRPHNLQVSFDLEDGADQLYKLTRCVWGDGVQYERDIPWILD